MVTKQNEKKSNVSSDKKSLSVRERTVDDLRNAIFRFELHPGQRLVEREFVELLGISRATFREAIRDLASEGLVTVIPQKGAHVTTPTIEEAEELYEIRAVLESLVVSRFVELASDDEIEQLVVALANIVAVVEKTTDTNRILEVKEVFYRTLIEGSRSQILEKLLTSIKARVRPLRAISLSVPGRARKTVGELESVTSAIKLRDSDLAATLYSLHVRTAADLTIKSLREMMNSESGSVITALYPKQASN